MLKKEKRISLRFDDAAWSFIKHMSVDTGESMNEIVGNLVLDLMKKHMKKNHKSIDSGWCDGKMTSP